MYHDFSCVKNDKSLSNSKCKMFPTLLHELLSDPEYSHIVTWLPHSRSFVILNRKEFESVIIQTEFKLTKVKSFVRQLNGWGYHRVKKGPEEGSYFHKVRIK